MIELFCFVLASWLAIQVEEPLELRMLCSDIN